jgi:hypothetical protein
MFWEHLLELFKGEVRMGRADGDYGCASAVRIEPLLAGECDAGERTSPPHIGCAVQACNERVDGLSRRIIRFVAGGLTFEVDEDYGRHPWIVFDGVNDFRQAVDQSSDVLPRSVQGDRP